VRACRSGVGWGRGSGLRQRAAEGGEHAGVEGVGLGEPPGGAGEVADLAGIDDRERQVGASEGGGHGQLEAGSTPTGN
jgi:hypothetical protein